jgi:hypothetical protein
MRSTTPLADKHSYLIAAKVIYEPLEHMQLSKLCLYQFCFPSFDDKLTADQMVSHVRAGDFALLDYSIANWIPHLLASLPVNSPGNSSELPEHVLTDFVEILCIFLEVHWAKPEKKSRASKSMVNAVNRLPQLESAQKVQLLQTLASANSLVASDLKDSKRFEASKLYNIQRNVRFTIEKLATDPTAQNDIQLFYGNNVFRCPRLYCKWFYEGFATAAKRDEHVSKHERAYYCPYIGCTHATLGCKTENELENHYQTYHKPSLTDDVFPLPPKPPTPPPPSPPAPAPAPPLTPPPPLSVSPTNSTPQSPAAQAPAPISSAVNQPAGSTPNHKRPSVVDPPPYQKPAKRLRQVGPFQCDMCTKVFHKIALFNSHKMVHSKMRPFSCAVCHKTFVRQPDLTRHGKLHLGVRKFTCHGSLRDGSDWGCRKKFTRADGLARHWKGTAGALCMKPLIDEEDRLKQQLTTPPIPTNAPAVAGGPSLGPVQSASSNHGVSMPGWDQMLLPGPQYLPGLSIETFAYDDRFPPVLFDQHPEILGINWDVVHPE